MDWNEYSVIHKVFMESPLCVNHGTAQAKAVHRLLVTISVFTLPVEAIYILLEIIL